MLTPDTKSDTVTSDNKPDDRTSEGANSIQPITTQVIGSQKNARESYNITEREEESEFFALIASGNIPEEINSTVTENITTTAHDLSTSELLLIIGVSFSSFLLILSAFIILALTLVVVVRYVPDSHNYYYSDQCIVIFLVM